jgi:hypothetical protein
MSPNVLINIYSLIYFLIYSVLPVNSMGNCENLRTAARSMEGATDLSVLSWELLQYDDKTEPIEAMEGHTSVTVLDRFVVIIGNIYIHIYIYVCRQETFIYMCIYICIHMNENIWEVIRPLRF